MKTRKLVFCILLLLSLSPAYSQNKLTYKFGFTGGVTAAQINTPALKTTTGELWHYTLGIALQQRFSQSFALAYELKYVRQGGRNQPFGNTFFTTEVNYVSLPVLGQFQPKGKPIFIEFGGQIGYFLSGSAYFAPQKDQAIPIRTATKFDAGLLAGLGYRFSQQVVIDARYYYGMRPINRDIETVDPVTGVRTSISPVHQYNRGYSLNLSYFF